MDWLLFAAQVDPLAALMAGLFLFSAGMFPVGILLPCSPCCSAGTPCASCTSGELPDTVTVTFDGFTDKTPGPDLITLGFSSCFGGGASARVTAPGGDPATDKGPISAVTLTAAGSGYAKLGRVAPTITASGGSGSGATLTVTTEKKQDSCKVDYWKVKTVSVSGGTGYADGDQVTFTVAEGDTEQASASATIHTTRTEPTLTASASGGTGATFDLSYTANGDTPSTWRISGITVTNGGTGYPDSAPLSFKLGSGDYANYPAYAYGRTTRSAPTLTASASGGTGASLSVSLNSYPWDGGYWSISEIHVTSGGTGYADGASISVSLGSGDYSQGEAYAIAHTTRVEPTIAVDTSGSAGSGAALSVSSYQTTDWSGNAVWVVSGITATSAGSGYSVGDPVGVSATSGVSTGEYFSASVSSVDGNGGITGISVDAGGAFYKDNGIIASIEVQYGGYYYHSDGVVVSVELYDGGSYYHDDGVPTGVTVESGGIYYHEDETADPYVADVTVTISQADPSTGTGGSIAATVDGTVGSATFGTITGLAIANGGNNYLAWKWVANACCGFQLNGKPIVLKRALTNQSSVDAGWPDYVARECAYFHTMCGGWGSQTSPSGFTSTSNGAMSIQVYYKGPNKPPCVKITRGGAASGDNGAQPFCSTFMCAEDPIEDCSSFSFSAEDAHGVVAAVTPGGEYDATYKYKSGCNQCCQGEDSMPSEIEVAVTDSGYYDGGTGGRSGTYVLAGGGLSWGYSERTGDTIFNISIGIGPGTCQSSDGCDFCVKKCEITAMCGYDFLPHYWFNPGDQDIRRCIYYDATLTDAERLQEACQSMCFSTPLCRPPAGSEFHFFQISGSDNWPSGPGNVCDENTQPQWQEGDPPGGPYTGPPRNHLNTFVLTVN